MGLDRELLQQRLLAAFKEESTDRLRILSDGLLHWQQGHFTEESIESLFREVHSLKGAARSASRNSIERICHAWETLFSALRNKQRALDPDVVELSLQAHGTVDSLCAEQMVPVEHQEALCLSLESAARGEPVMVPKIMRPLHKDKIGGEDKTVRVTKDRLENLLFIGEDVLQIRLEAEAHAQTLADTLESFNALRHKRSALNECKRALSDSAMQFSPKMQESLKRLLELAEWSVEKLEHTNARLNYAATKSNQLALQLQYSAAQLGLELQSVLLLPCQTLCSTIPTQVHELAIALNKQVRVQILGSDLQIDKRVLDELRVVLQHLIRNAIDHGVEAPNIRKARNKAAEGLLSIEWIQERSDRFELRLRDDGAGINSQQLKQNAIASGLLSAEQAQSMSESQALRLIFQSGLSTSQMLTDVSGRGLGLAIVQETIERIGGSIDVQSTHEQGTEIKVRLPLTISTFRIVLVQTAGQLFGVPAQAVERCLKLPRTAMKCIENQATIALDGSVLPLWFLADVLQLANTTEQVETLSVIILFIRGERMAFVIDELLGDQEITLKSLGKHLIKLRNVMGATLLGDGHLVPILHVQDLQISAHQYNGYPMSLVNITPVTVNKKILVAEDSFTSRGLLKAILEGADYHVTTASDGLEAWNLLKQSQFDLLVSDVEMPKMDGFTLTNKVRFDANLTALPIILVTALSSEEDRARGLAAGANAYLIKSGFEQDNLLQAIKRLL